MQKLFIILAFLFILSGCSTETNSELFVPTLDWKVGNFKAVNQNNQPVTLDDFKGTIWLTDFIFTNCDTVCSPMTFNLTKIQDRLAEEGVPDIKFVSFSVDPEVDTPEVLKRYMSLFHIGDENWSFLTGYDQEDIITFANNYFKTPILNDKHSNQVMHGTRFFLINKEGVVVNSYSGVHEVPFEQIIEDVKNLSASSN